ADAAGPGAGGLVARRPPRRARPGRVTPRVAGRTLSAVPRIGSGLLEPTRVPTAAVARSVCPSGPVDPLRRPKTSAHPDGCGTDLSRLVQPSTEGSLEGPFLRFSTTRVHDRPDDNPRAPTATIPAVSPHGTGSPTVEHRSDVDAAAPVRGLVEGVCILW